jgi:hypothetical protein
MAEPKRKNDQPSRAGREPSGLGRVLRWVLAPILAPFQLIFGQVRLVILVFVFAFGACAACGIFAPAAFQSVIDTVRNAGLRTYTFIIGITGNPALKVTAYEATVTGIGQVERDMPFLLRLAFGQGARVEGSVRVALGADLLNEQFGVLTCEIDYRTVKVGSGSAPLAGTAFDIEQIEREAYKALTNEAAKQSIEKYWPEARKVLLGRFEAWALGLKVPEQPTLTGCPDISAPIQQQ